MQRMSVCSLPTTDHRCSWAAPPLTPALPPDLQHLLLPTLEDQSGLPEARSFRSEFRRGFSRRGGHSATCGRCGQWSGRSGAFSIYPPQVCQVLPLIPRDEERKRPSHCRRAKEMSTRSHTPPIRTEPRPCLQALPCPGTLTAGSQHKHKMWLFVQASNHASRGNTVSPDVGSASESAGRDPGRRTWGGADSLRTVAHGLLRARQSSQNHVLKITAPPGLVPGHNALPFLTCPGVPAHALGPPRGLGDGCGGHLEANY